VKVSLGAGPVRVALVYMVIAGLWILLSDQALRLITSDVEVLVTWSTYKGWFFVLVTGILLFAERQRAERAFRRSEMRFKHAAERFPDGFVIYDADRRFEFVNAAGLLFAGYRDREMIGRRDEELFPPEVTSLYLPAIRKAIEGRRTETVECTLPLASGPATLHLTYVPLLDEHGEVFQLLGIVRDITGQRLFERQLKDTLREKETLLSEVHHRVKNNLQVVSSLLNLQGGGIRNVEVLEALRESQNRIRSMALIHEKLYQARTLSRIDLGEYIRDLGTQLARSFGDGRVHMEFDLEAIHFGVDKAIPCGLILNELVSNALKHAFPAGERGTVSIGLRCIGVSRYVLRVRDNGVGFPDTIDHTRTSSLGMQLVNTLTSQLNGRVDLERNGGTTVSITFTA
jgi:PAS domain S-box-containing protein